MQQLQIIWKYFISIIFFFESKNYEGPFQPRASVFL